MPVSASVAQPFLTSQLEKVWFQESLGLGIVEVDGRHSGLAVSNSTLALRVLGARHP